MNAQLTQQSFSQPLLTWYHANRRSLPFRTHSTPYRVWVSEIMLQQTRVNAVLAYYERFMQALPSIQALAECPDEKLMKLWQGLGYYSRARNLQKAAQIIMQQHGGELPADFQLLCALPGIGEYTAGAIASICFQLPVPAVDGNVLRVFSRLLLDTGDITRPDTKKRLTAEVQRLQPVSAAGDYNQALMELGALVCVPNGAPLCERCPVAQQCQAHLHGQQQTVPYKPPKPARRIEHYTIVLVFSTRNNTRQLLLTKRADSGLLKGLWQPLLLEGTHTRDQTQQSLYRLGLHGTLATELRSARHVFTHLEWHMTGWTFECSEDCMQAAHSWVEAAQLQTEYATPNAVKFYINIAKKLL